MSTKYRKNSLPIATEQRLFNFTKYECTDIVTKPGKWILPCGMDFGAVKKFPIYQDDVWIVTLPKCGMAWVQDLIWLIMNGLDVEKSQINQFSHVPILELSAVCKSYPTAPTGEDQYNERYPEGELLNEDTVKQYTNHSMEHVRGLKRPRIIVSHLPISLLPDNLLNTCKVVYVARNIKDAAVSHYHHLNIGPGIDKEDFKQFALCFLNDEIEYGPYIPHILEAWEKRKCPNMFFTTYEEMKMDLRKEAFSLVTFLHGANYRLPNSSMDKLLKAVGSEHLRRNEFININRDISPNNINSFICNGMIGEWKNYFDEAMEDEWDSSIERQLLGTDYNMIFEDLHLVIND